MEQLIIKNARLNGATTDILIENGRFKTFAPHITPSQEQCELFDACGMTIVPPFFNASYPCGYDAVPRVRRMISNSLTGLITIYGQLKLNLLHTTFTAAQNSLYSK